jgi:hypothetical protein
MQVQDAIEVVRSARTIAQVRVDDHGAIIFARVRSLSISQHKHSPTRMSLTAEPSFHGAIGILGQREHGIMSFHPTPRFAADLSNPGHCFIPETGRTPVQR